MPSLKEIVKELSEDATEDQEWMPSLGSASRGMPPVVTKIVQEIGDDVILAEATLRWVRVKKQQLTQSQLATLYGAEYLETLKRKLENSP